MELHFGAQVEPRDGIRLGDLTRVVYEPEARQVQALVVETADTHEAEILVPIEAVDAADDETVQLALSTEQFDSLDQYAWAHNVAPPPDRDHADIAEEDEIGPGTESPPVGAATGIESIAFTPIIEEEDYIPLGDGVIDRSTEVWGTDGRLGHVHAVFIEDDTRRIQTFLVREGTVFTHDVEIDVGWVESMHAETIVLEVDKATVEAANRE
ncbi:MAG TPA: hypothetical protein VF221_04075 [Chloroflexota bacterium]